MWHRVAETDWELVVGDTVKVRSISGLTFSDTWRTRFGQRFRCPILLQSQVWTAVGEGDEGGGATVRCGWRPLHSHEGGENRRGDVRRKLKPETLTSFFFGMPKKVCVMCFFLPQVHRRKAQAQFPLCQQSGSRWAVPSPVFLFLLFSILFKTSRHKKRVGWTPLTCTQSTWDRRLLAWKLWVICRKN